MPKRKKPTKKEQNAEEEKKQSGGLFSSLGNLAGYVNPFNYISGNGEGDKEENEKLIENEDTENTNTKKRRKKKKKKITEKDNYEENSAKIESGEVLEKGESLEKEKENEKENLDIDQIKKENEELIKKIDEYTKDTNIMYITTMDTDKLASKLNLEKHTELKSNVKDINNYCVYSKFANNNKIKDVGVIIFSSFLDDETKKNKSTWQIIQEIMDKKFQNTIQFYDYNPKLEFKCSKIIKYTNKEQDLNTLYKYILEMVQNGKKITIPLDNKIESNDTKKEEINEIKKEEDKEKIINSISESTQSGKNIVMISENGSELLVRDLKLNIYKSFEIDKQKFAFYLSVKTDKLENLDVNVVIFDNDIDENFNFKSSDNEIIKNFLSKVSQDKFDNTINVGNETIKNFAFAEKMELKNGSNDFNDYNNILKTIENMLGNGKKISIEKNVGNKEDESIYEEPENKSNQENNSFRSTSSELNENNENDKDNENNKGKEEQNEKILNREEIDNDVKGYELEDDLEKGLNLEIDNNINNEEPFDLNETKIQKNDDDDDNDNEDELKLFIEVDKNKHKNSKFEKIKYEFKKTEDNDNNENKMNKSVIINLKSKIDDANDAKESLNKSVIIRDSKNLLEKPSSKTNTEKSDLQKENNDENVKQILSNLKSTKDLVNEFLNSVNKGTKGQVKKCIIEFYKIVCTNLQSLGINFTNVTKRDEYLKKLKGKFKNDAKKIANKFPVWSFDLANGLKDSHFYKRLNGEIDKDGDFIKIKNSKDKRSNIIKRFGKGFVNFFTGKPGKHKTIDQVNSVLKKYSEPWAIAWVLSRGDNEKISENSMITELDKICANKKDNDFNDALNGFIEKVGAKVKANMEGDATLNDIFGNASGSSKIKKRVKSIYKRLNKIHKDEENYAVAGGNDDIINELNDEKNKGFFSGFFGLFSRKKNK